MKWWMKTLIASLVWIILCAGSAYFFFPVSTISAQDTDLSETLGEILSGGLVVVWVIALLLSGKLRVVKSKIVPDIPEQQINEAIQFFLSKIIEESAYEGVVLSEVEKKMLEYSQLRQAEMAHTRLQFEKEYNKTAFEKKIIGLIRAGYRRDIGILSKLEDSKMLFNYRQAFNRLKKQQYYLSALLSDALFETLEPFTLVLTTTENNFMRPDKKANIVLLNAFFLVMAMGFALWISLNVRQVVDFVNRYDGSWKAVMLLMTMVIYFPLALATRSLIYFIRNWMNSKTG